MFENFNSGVETAQRNVVVAVLCTAEHLGNALTHCGTQHNDDSKSLRYSE